MHHNMVTQRLQLEEARQEFNDTDRELLKSTEKPTSGDIREVQAKLPMGTEFTSFNLKDLPPTGEPLSVAKIQELQLQHAAAVAAYEAPSGLPTISGVYLSYDNLAP